MIVIFLLGVWVEILIRLKGVEGYEIEGVRGLKVFGVRDFIYRLVFLVCFVFLSNLRVGIFKI